MGIASLRKLTISDMTGRITVRENITRRVFAMTDDIS
jgi:hypothetical protein